MHHVSMKNSKNFLGRGTIPRPNPYWAGTPLLVSQPREATTVDHSVKQYIDECLPATTGKVRESRVLGKVVTLEVV